MTRAEFRTLEEALASIVNSSSFSASERSDAARTLCTLTAHKEIMIESANVVVNTEVGL